jgi:hypothetical protein
LRIRHQLHLSVIKWITVGGRSRVGGGTAREPRYVRASTPMDMQSACGPTVIEALYSVRRKRLESRCMLLQCEAVRNLAEDVLHGGDEGEKDSHGQQGDLHTREREHLKRAFKGSRREDRVPGEAATRSVVRWRWILERVGKSRRSGGGENNFDIIRKSVL